MTFHFLLGQKNNMTHILIPYELETAADFLVLWIQIQLFFYFSWFYISSLRSIKFFLWSQLQWSSTYMDQKDWIISLQMLLKLFTCSNQIVQFVFMLCTFMHDNKWKKNIQNLRPQAAAACTPKSWWEKERRFLSMKTSCPLNFWQTAKQTKHANKMQAAKP